MIDKLHAAFHHWWKLPSNWLALAVSGIAGWATSNQATILSWFDSVQQPYRAIITMLAVAALPIALRAVEQAKTSAPEQP